MNFYQLISHIPRRASEEFRGQVTSLSCFRAFPNSFRSAAGAVSERGHCLQKLKYYEGLWKVHHNVYISGMCQRRHSQPKTYQYVRGTEGTGSQQQGQWLVVYFLSCFAWKVKDFSWIYAGSEPFFQNVSVNIS